MYDNENYTNPGNYYQTSLNEPQVYEKELQEEAKPQKQKKSGKAGRFFKKAVACAGIGLCFGLCAGVGIYAVGESTGVFDKWQRAGDVSSISTEQFSQEDIQAMVDKVQALTESSGAHNTTNITSVSSDVTEVVEKVMPSMVSIINQYSERVTYFGQPLEREGNASGSGIIVGENETELLIATNYHVIEDAKKLTVYFIDNTEAKATVKGTDADMDLAVIAVPFKELEEGTKNAISIARMGDSDSLKLGEPVIAIGNAMGYGQSVTGGWVSALNREVELEDGSTGTFIQTDAAINPGNSGGALLNVNGEVIGINSNKIGGTFVEGIGYAIPISAAQPILEDLMTKGQGERVPDGTSGYLGIVPQTVTDEINELYGIPKGVFVSRVEEGTPAAEGGIKQGDIIRKIGGTRITTAEELRNELAYYHAGETVEIVIVRNQDGEYEEITLEVTLGNRP